MMDQGSKHPEKAGTQGSKDKEENMRPKTDLHQKSR